jgi:hypothetical protein
MNKAKLIELMKTGAVFNAREFKIYHPSFRKGFRSLTCADISWVAAEKVIRQNLSYENGVYKFVA